MCCVRWAGVTRSRKAQSASVSGAIPAPTKSIFAIELYRRAVDKLRGMAPERGGMSADPYSASVSRTVC